MALKPENPVVGGTVLRRQAIRSPNFVAGSAGWTINQDGSAEFNNVTVRGTIISGHFVGDGEGQELLIYTGPPALGNLLVSIVSVGGTDSVGNAFLPGTTTYTTGITPIAVNVSGGQLSWQTAATQAGPYTSRGAIQIDASNNLQIKSIASGAILAMLAAGGASLNQGLDIISAGGGLLQITETAGAPLSPPLQMIGLTAGDRAFGVKVAGDAAFRMRVDTNGRHTWGDGTITDVTLYRGGASILQTDDVFALTDIAAPAGAALETQVFSATGQLSMVNSSGMTTKVSGAKLAAVGTTTVTQATLTNLFNDTIKANDAKVGAVYEIEAFGFGQWGSTQQALTLAIRFGATDATTIGITPTIANVAFSANANFRWEAKIILACVTTGAAATWVATIKGCVTQTGTINPGSAASNTVPFVGGTGSGTVTLDSTVDQILGLSANWASTTGAPTLTRVMGHLRRPA